MTFTPSYNPDPKPVPQVKAPKIGVRRVNTARKHADDLRVYGPPARRKWVNLQPCQACGEWGFSQNAHLLGNDGAGRKQGYTTIGSLCTVRPATMQEVAAMKVRAGEMWPGCHHLFDEQPTRFKELFPAFNPAKAARLTERRWQTFLKTGSAHV